LKFICALEPPRQSGRFGTATERRGYNDFAITHQIG